MIARLRFPILVAIGLALGLVIGLALAHFLWPAIAVIALAALASSLWRKR